MKRKLVLLALIVLFIVPFSAQAASFLFWEQPFMASGPFNQLEAEMNNQGDSFFFDGFGEFDDSSWSSELINPGYAVAKGDSLNEGEYLGFSLFFAGYFSNPLDIDFTFLLNDEITEKLNLDWDGGSWTITNSVQNEPVPEPATMFLLGSGLFGLGFGRYRKKNKIKNKQDYAIA